MSPSEFPAPGAGGGIDSKIEIIRAKPMVLRNSRVFVGATLGMSVFAAFIAVSLLLLAMSFLFPLSDLTLDRGRSASLWVLRAMIAGFASPWLWSLGRDMAGYQIQLNSRGVEFKLGTKKKPADLFLAWSQIADIKSRRSGIDQQYLIQATNGSEATISSYSFFRPKKVARLIAARAGLDIHKA